MAHHKRGKPKNARSGCLLCKPHKANGAKNKNRASVARVLQTKCWPGYEPDWSHGHESR